MLSSWADHCSSSDEEGLTSSYKHKSVSFGGSDSASSDEEHHGSFRSSRRGGSFDQSPPRHHDGSQQGNYGPRSPNRPRPSSSTPLPSSPPYTAFIGNLSSKVHPEDLKGELEHWARECLKREIMVEGARIVASKKGREAGVFFGYVELRTVEDLAAILELDNEVSLGCNDNRRLKVEVANTLRRSSGGSTGNLRRHNNAPPSPTGGGGGFRRGISSGELPYRNHEQPTNEDYSIDNIDGSNFRRKQRGQQQQNNSGRYSLGSNNTSGRGDSTGSLDGVGSRPAGQRPKLALAPRTKPISSGKQEMSDIFGGAKARDESQWEKKRREEQQQQQKEAEKQSQAMEEHVKESTAGSQEDAQANTAAPAPHEESKRRGSTPSAPLDSKYGRGSTSNRKDGRPDIGGRGGRPRGDSGRGRGDSGGRGGRARGDSAGRGGRARGEGGRGVGGRGLDGGRGRGGRGKNDGGRGERRGSKQSHNATGGGNRRQSNHNNGNASRENTAKRTSSKSEIKGKSDTKHQAAAHAYVEASTTKKIVNKFAALGFDSDSD